MKQQAVVSVLLVVGLCVVPRIADCQTRQPLAMPASDERGVIGPWPDQDAAVAKIKAMLVALPARVPDLSVGDAHTYGNAVTIFYFPNDQINNQRLPIPWNAMIMSFSYPSLEQAQRGVETSERMTSVVPDRKETSKGITIYRWNRRGTNRILFRAGTNVFDIETRGPRVPPVPKIFDVLVQESGTN